MITWEQIAVMGVFFLVICVVVTCIFLIRLILGLTDSVKIVNEMLRVNKDNINTTLKDMPILYDNLVDISVVAKKKMKDVEHVIDNINDTTEMTSAAANTIMNEFVGKAKSIMDIVNLLLKLIFYNKEASDNRKG